MRIRPAQTSDVEQLAAMCEALWPTSSAEEHAKELRLILGGKADLVLTMPISMLIAEASDGELLGFVEVDYVRMQTGAIPRNQWATSRGGTLPSITASEEWAGNCLRRRRHGLGVTIVSRLPPMPLSIMSAPNVHTRPWVMRSWTAACTIGRGFRNREQLPWQGQVDVAHGRSC
jgi:hypothetical protein